MSKPSKKKGQSAAVETTATVEPVAATEAVVETPVAAEGVDLSDAGAPTPIAQVPAPAAPAEHETEEHIPEGGNAAAMLQRERRKLLNEIGKLGELTGSGKAALITMLEKVVRAAADKIITEDDAQMVYERFRKQAVAGAGASAVVEQDDKSLKAQVSKLKKIIECGAKIEDAWDVFELARDRHIAALKCDDRDNLRIKSTYEALLSIAREQLKEERRGIKLDEEAINEILFLPEHEQKTKGGVDFITAALEQMEKARDGRPATETREARAPIKHEGLDNAISWAMACIRDLHPEYLKLREREAEEEAQKAAEKAAKAAERQAAADKAKTEKATKLAAWSPKH